MYLFIWLRWVLFVALRILHLPFSVQTLSCCVWESSSLTKGTNPGPLPWEQGVLTTGLPGKSPLQEFSNQTSGR